MNSAPLRSLLALLSLLLIAPACDDTTPRPGADTGPGDASDMPDPGGMLVINELSAGAADDWFELYNGTASEIDLATLQVSDDLADAARRTALPPGSGVLAPGGYAVIYLSTTGWPGWQLGDDEELGLFGPDGVALDGADWQLGQSPDGASFGRIPDVAGEFKTLLTPTPGAANLDNDAGATCGDGLVEGSEGCDDANRSDKDGCSARCQVEPDWTCTGAPSVCETNCGDGIRTNPEQCDPGIVTSSLPCDDQCRLTVTGTSPVRINEAVWRDADAAAADWIELVNTGAEAVELGGFRLADEDFDENFTPLPPGLSIAPGAHLLFRRDNSVDPQLSFGFGLDANDAVLLIDAGGALVDIADWTDGSVPSGASFGRQPDASGAFTTLDAPTPGAANN